MVTKKKNFFWSSKKITPKTFFRLTLATCSPESKSLCTRLIIYLELCQGGNLKHFAHAGKKISLFGEKKIWFVTTIDLIKCVEQIKQQIFLLTCAPISELPSDMSTMSWLQLYEIISRIETNTSHGDAYFNLVLAEFTNSDSVF